jgi:putrescine transport system permease protein
MSRLGPGLILALIVGFAFLYLPILTLIAYSFNASRLVTVWAASRRTGTAR